MPGLEDYQYQTPELGAGGRSSRRRITLAVGAGAIVIGAIVGGVWFWSRQAPTSSPQPVEVAKATSEPLAPAPTVERAPEYVLPPLEGSDAFLRERFRELSGSPVMAVWLRGTGLVRNLVVVLDNTSRGLNPARHLRRLAPASSFRTIQRGNRLVLDPRNYQRFTPIADAASSIDPERAGRLYVALKPLLQIAYDELGNHEPVDAALERAMRQLLGAPIVEGDVVLEIGGEGTGYRFASTALESLPAVQKQLVRMGPSNERLIQTRLRQFALAAGITSDRLPATP